MLRFCRRMSCSTWHPAIKTPNIENTCMRKSFRTGRGACVAAWSKGSQLADARCMHTKWRGGGKGGGSCGGACIFKKKGLEPNVDFTQEDIESNDNGKLSNNTYIANIINKYKNKFGKSRVVVIKSQLGQPITAYSGDKVYWTVPKKLPKMTKLMIDGKALYIHRANYQIIDTSLLN